MSRTQQAAQRLQQTQREKILDAARQVFARKGLAATSDDIAAAASIRHGLAYRYFASKEEIIDALIAQAIQQSSGLGQAAEWRLPTVSRQRYERPMRSINVW